MGLFYDGNYFLHVSNYYYYYHARRERISVPGFHYFVRNLVAELEEAEVNYCRIVDAHYFRGRLSAQEASHRQNQLYNDRVFDDILMSMGIVSHFVPLRTRDGRKEEKGVDVWLALEAYELARQKELDVVVLVTSDGEYVPLVRKLSGIGVRTMVLNWEFEYTDEHHNEVVTRTSQDLLQEVTYSIRAHEVIEKGLDLGHEYVSDLFYQIYTGEEHTTSNDHQPEERPIHAADDQRYTGVVMSVHANRGYGFIRFPPDNLFFYHEELEGIPFSQLLVGEEVEFSIGHNSGGQRVAKRIRRPGM
ncbi:MAG: cold-shock protein [Bacteroidetes bacterium]|nr:MAG: cold-shock protein [Bacteroidota bacterium]